MIDKATAWERISRALDRNAAGGASAADVCAVGFDLQLRVGEGGPPVYVVDRPGAVDGLHLFADRGNAERFRDALHADGCEAILSEEPLCDDSTAALVEAVTG